MQSGRKYRAGATVRPRTNGWRADQLPLSPGGVRQGEPNCRSVVGSSPPKLPSELGTGLGDWDGQNGLVSSVVSPSRGDSGLTTSAPAGQRCHRLMLTTATSSRVPSNRVV